MMHSPKKNACPKTCVNPLSYKTQDKIVYT